MTEQQLPEGWQMVKFGDIAKHISKRVEPTETDLEIYVGLEHLDPDSLKIKRHGVPSDVAGQKLLVKKGQIIFGKRRAYQRKVAVADWDCICSAHAMVLEANPKSVLPDFLPFFMQSDVFMERAVAISEGSLSPTIKWKVLENQSFIFPIKENQKILLEIFKKLELARFAANDAYLSFEKFKKTFLTKLLNQHMSQFGMQSVADLCVQITDGTHDTPDPVDYGVPLVTSKHLVDNKILFENCYQISELSAAEINKRSAVESGDILFAMIGKIGSPVIVSNDSPSFCIKNVALFKMGGDQERAAWLKMYLESPIFEREIQINQSGNAQKFLPLKYLRTFVIPKFSDESLLLLEHYNILNEESLMLHYNLEKTMFLEKSTRNKIFSF
ncbi:restriction endonuclease subunit S [Aeromonas veronii]|uniref:restriction endonuclease subunit S n=1 Tax=Aeromonas veronii TaxID=654 RepID=UPI002245962E|nr:restriction endonuclease subunit S [Aeromonas veronii]MCX0443932.1 restriction endonuclease subunit S [Aeromonas veronii]